MTLKELSKLYINTKYSESSMPAHAMPKQTYSDKTANGLTRAICDFIRLEGGYADRINNMGVYVKPKTIDRGHEILIERGKYIKSGTRRGIADIMASKDGRMVAIEVKIGKDRMSEHQRKIEQEVNESGGIYLIARSWSQFFDEWERIGCCDGCGMPENECKCIAVHLCMNCNNEVEQEGDFCRESCIIEYRDERY